MAAYEPLCDSPGEWQVTSAYRTYVKTVWSLYGCPNYTPAQRLQFEEEEQCKALGLSPSGSYELMHELDFPVLRIDRGMVVSNEKFL